MILPWYVIRSTNGGQHAAQRTGVARDGESGPGWITLCGIPLLRATVLAGVWNARCIRCRAKLYGKRATKQWNDERSQGTTKEK
jgi:hypothetical protein